MFQEHLADTVLSFLDNLVVAKTGQNLDYLQKIIIEGSFDGKKYAEIAKEFHVSESHIRDKASELWRILGQILGENINKSNIRGILKKAQFYNNNNNLVRDNIVRDFVSLNNVHICTNNPSPIEKSSEPLANPHTPLVTVQGGLSSSQWH